MSDRQTSALRGRSFPYRPPVEIEAQTYVKVLCANTVSFVADGETDGRKRAIRSLSLPRVRWLERGRT